MRNRTVNRAYAKKVSKHYRDLADALMDAQIALTHGGVKSYTIGDRSLTRFDLKGLQDELEEALRLADEWDAIANGRPQRALVGIITTDI